MSQCLGSGTCPCCFGIRSPKSFLSPGMSLRPFLARFGETSLSCTVGGEPRVQVRHLSTSTLSILLIYFFWLIFCHLLTSLLVILCTVKRRPKLKSRYRQRVEAAIEYVRTIEDFDDLVNLQTLAFHCLSLVPSAFVLRNIEIEEKKSKCYAHLCCFFPFPFFFFFNKCFPFVGMMTKFNQGMYA